MAQLKVEHRREAVTDIDPSGECTCGHSWAEHNVFNDCEHLDGRTRTGLCERCA